MGGKESKEQRGRKLESHDRHRWSHGQSKQNHRKRWRFHLHVILAASRGDRVSRRRTATASRIIPGWQNERLLGGRRTNKGAASTYWGLLNFAYMSDAILSIYSVHATVSDSIKFQRPLFLYRNPISPEVHRSTDTSIDEHWDSANLLTLTSLHFWRQGQWTYRFSPTARGIDAHMHVADKCHGTGCNMGTIQCSIFTQVRLSIHMSQAPHFKCYNTRACKLYMMYVTEAVKVLINERVGG